MYVWHAGIAISGEPKQAVKSRGSRGNSPVPVVVPPPSSDKSGNETLEYKTKGGNLEAKSRLGEVMPMQATEVGSEQQARERDADNKVDRRLSGNTPPTSTPLSPECLELGDSERSEIEAVVENMKTTLETRSSSPAETEETS